MKKRGVWKNKRAVATELLIEAMQALAVMLILTGTIVFVNNELEKIGFAKRFYARDMGLLTTAMHSAPGNVFFLYSFDTVLEDEPDKYKFNYLIAENIIRVNATNSPKHNSYWYFSDLNMRNISSSESERIGIVKFVKEGDKIDMGYGAKANGNIQQCLPLNTYNPAWYSNKLIIDPAHGEKGTDLGAVNSETDTFNEEERALAIASNDGFKKLRVGEKRLLTRGQGTGQRFVPMDKKSEFVAQNSDSNSLILSIHTGDSTDKSMNYIKAYYNINSGDSVRMKSSKLGCEILNSILKKKDLQNNDDINGIAVIPSDSEYINKIIPSGRVGVLLELGNIQISKDKNFLADTSDLAESLYLGIENYYSK